MPSQRRAQDGGGGQATVAPRVPGLALCGELQFVPLAVTRLSVGRTWAEASGPQGSCPGPLPPCRLGEGLSLSHPPGGALSQFFVIRARIAQMCCATQLDPAQPQVGGKGRI